MISPPPVPRVAAVERGHGGEGGEGPGEIVGDGDAGPDRRAVGLPGQVQQSAERDAEAVQARARRVGPALAEHADAHVDEFRREVVGTESPAFHRAGAEVLAQDVRLRHQPLEQVLAFRSAQVARHAAPAPALDRPREGVVGLLVTVHEGPHGAHEVAFTRQLHLDHLGSELAEQPRAERCRDPRPGVHHPDARQGARDVLVGHVGSGPGEPEDALADQRPLDLVGAGEDRRRQVVEP